jgi:hypothetical protein
LPLPCGIIPSAAPIATSVRHIKSPAARGYTEASGIGRQGRDDTPVASGARRSIAHSLISSPFGEPNRQWHRLLTSTETNKAYEITTELLGMDEKNVEVR